MPSETKTVLCDQCAGVGYVRDRRRDENGELWHHECAACSGRGLVTANLAADTVTVKFERPNKATPYGDPRETCVYLAGPMTGREQFNFPAFRGAAEGLRAMHYDTVNPAETDGGSTDQPREFYLWESIRRVFVGGCNTIVLLRDWEQSIGATLEAYLFAMCGRPVYRLGGEPVSVQTVCDALRALLDERIDRDERDVCEIAADLVNGARRYYYGHPADNLKQTAELLTALWRHKLRPGETITARDVAWAMTCVKAARDQTKPKRDNLVDVCGWALTADLLREASNVE